MSGMLRSSTISAVGTERQLFDRFETARRLGEAAGADVAQGRHHHPAHRRRVVDDQGSVHGPAGSSIVADRGGDRRARNARFCTQHSRLKDELL